MSRVARDVIPQQFPLQKASLQPIPNLINQHSLNDLAKEETKSGHDDNNDNRGPEYSNMEEVWIVYGDIIPFYIVPKNPDS